MVGLAENDKNDFPGVKGQMTLSIAGCQSSSNYSFKIQDQCQVQEKTQKNQKDGRIDRLLVDQKDQRKIQKAESNDLCDKREIENSQIDHQSQLIDKQKSQKLTEVPPGPTSSSRSKFKSIPQDSLYNNQQEQQSDRNQNLTQEGQDFVCPETKATEKGQYYQMVMKLARDHIDQEEYLEMLLAKLIFHLHYNIQVMYVGFIGMFLQMIQKKILDIHEQENPKQEEEHSLSHQTNEEKHQQIELKVDKENDKSEQEKSLENEMDNQDQMANQKLVNDHNSFQVLKEEMEIDQCHIPNSKEKDNTQIPENQQDKPIKSEEIENKQQQIVKSDQNDVSKPSPSNIIQISGMNIIQNYNTIGLGPLAVEKMTKSEINSQISKQWPFSPTNNLDLVGQISRKQSAEFQKGVLGTPMTPDGTMGISYQAHQASSSVISEITSPALQDRIKDESMQNISDKEMIKSKEIKMYILKQNQQIQNLKKQLMQVKMKQAFDQNEKKDLSQGERTNDQPTTLLNQLQMQEQKSKPNFLYNKNQVDQMLVGGSDAGSKGNLVKWNNFVDKFQQSQKNAMNINLIQQIRREYNKSERGNISEQCKQKSDNSHSKEKIVFRNNSFNIVSSSQRTDKKTEQDASLKNKINKYLNLDLSNLHDKNHAGQKSWKSYHYYQGEIKSSDPKAQEQGRNDFLSNNDQGLFGHLSKVSRISNFSNNMSDLLIGQRDTLSKNDIGQISELFKRQFIMKGKDDMGQMMMNEEMKHQQKEKHISPHMIVRPLCTINHNYIINYHEKWKDKRACKSESMSMSNNSDGQIVNDKSVLSSESLYSKYVSGKKKLIYQSKKTKDSIIKFNKLMQEILNTKNQKNNENSRESSDKNTRNKSQIKEIHKLNTKSPNDPENKKANKINLQACELQSSSSKIEVDSKVVSEKVMTRQQFDDFLNDMLETQEHQQQQAKKQKNSFKEKEFELTSRGKKQLNFMSQGRGHNSSKPQKESRNLLGIGEISNRNMYDMHQTCSFGKLDSKQEAQYIAAIKRAGHSHTQTQSQHKKSMFHNKDVMRQIFKLKKALMKINDSRSNSDMSGQSPTSINIKEHQEMKIIAQQKEAKAKSQVPKYGGFKEPEAIIEGQDQGGITGQSVQNVFQKINDQSNLNKSVEHSIKNYMSNTNSPRPIVAQAKTPSEMNEQSCDIKNFKLNHQSIQFIKGRDNSFRQLMKDSRTSNDAQEAIIMLCNQIIQNSFKQYNDQFTNERKNSISDTDENYNKFKPMPKDEFSQQLDNFLLDENFAAEFNENPHQQAHQENNKSLKSLSSYISHAQTGYYQIPIAKTQDFVDDNQSNVSKQIHQFFNMQDQQQDQQIQRKDINSQMHQSYSQLMKQQAYSRQRYESNTANSKKGFQSPINFLRSPQMGYINDYQDQHNHLINQFRNQEKSDSPIEIQENKSIPHHMRQMDHVMASPGSSYLEPQGFGMIGNNAFHTSRISQDIKQRVLNSQSHIQSLSQSQGRSQQISKRLPNISPHQSLLLTQNSQSPPGLLCQNMLIDQPNTATFRFKDQKEVESVAGQQKYAHFINEDEVNHTQKTRKDSEQKTFMQQINQMIKEKQERQTGNQIKRKDNSKEHSLAKEHQGKLFSVFKVNKSHDRSNKYNQMSFDENPQTNQHGTQSFTNRGDPNK